jgi:hypothetical protein
MTSEILAPAAGPLAAYLPDEEMAKVRRVTPRTQRAERQRGNGPPFVRDGKKIYYPLDGFRDWLKARTCQPVRSGLAR